MIPARSMKYLTLRRRSAPNIHYFDVLRRNPCGWNSPKLSAEFPNSSCFFDLKKFTARGTSKPQQNAIVQYFLATWNLLPEGLFPHINRGRETSAGMR